jgi:hypothetical protein
MTDEMAREKWDETVMSSRPVLPGFDYRRVDVAGVTINCAVAGSGRRCCCCTAIPRTT